jgi:hypothetical protein
MTLTERIAAFIALHNPEARQQHMVYSVWEDGEITIEKGGAIFGQRSLHCVSFVTAKNPLPVDSMPVKNYDNSHGRIFCDTKEIAEKAHALVLDNFISC